MPLGSPIGSGRGIFTREEIEIIIENAKVPVVVDAGLGAPSDASLALEIGADAVLVNTAIAQAKDPVAMAEGFRYGGRGRPEGVSGGAHHAQGDGAGVEPDRRRRAPGVMSGRSGFEAGVRPVVS